MNINTLYVIILLYIHFIYKKPGDGNIGALALLIAIFTLHFALLTVCWTLHLHLHCTAGEIECWLHYFSWSPGFTIYLHLVEALISIEWGEYMGWCAGAHQCKRTFLNVVHTDVKVQCASAEKFECECWKVWMCTVNRIFGVVFHSRVH